MSEATAPDRNDPTFDGTLDGSVVDPDGSVVDLAHADPDCPRRTPRRKHTEAGQYDFESRKRHRSVERFHDGVRPGIRDLAEEHQCQVELRRLNPRAVVPGHGPVAGPEVLDECEAYLRWVQRTAERGHRAGQAPLALARDADLAGFGRLLDPERLVGNLHRAYAELDGAPPGAPIDIMAGFGEMPRSPSLPSGRQNRGGGQVARR